MNKILTTILATALLLPTHANAEGSIEVVHHLTSEGEAKALNVIRDALSAKGVEWKDAATGGLDNVMQALQTRLVAGNPPGAMLFPVGWDALNWADQGALRDLTDLAVAGDWATALPPQFASWVEHDGKFIAAPINLHRENWIWANKTILDDNGIAIPKSWPELIASAQKLKDLGIVPLAMSDEPWQFQLIFDAIMADVNGPDFYRRAAIDLDPTALNSPEMIKAFDTLRQVREVVGDSFIGREWSVATYAVIEGEAAMQIMGDWAKAEFLARDLLPNEDFYCFATPGEVMSFQYNINSFGFFPQTDLVAQSAQFALAETIMDPVVQEEFALLKGGIPARLDIPSDRFDACAKTALSDRNLAVENDSLLGTLSLGFAAKPEFAAVFTDVVREFFVGNTMTSEEAVQYLVDGIENAR